jgi:hypothetical protein
VTALFLAEYSASSTWKHLAEVIKKMANLLEALSWQLAVTLEQKQESSIEFEH